MNSATELPPTFEATSVQRHGRANTAGLHPDIVEHGVLLVEDCPVQRGLAAELLEAAGVTRLFEVNDGFNAGRLLRRLSPPPAVVALDLNMPRLDGFDTMQLLAALPHPPALLVLSGSDRAVLESVSVLARELGLELLGALPKPLDAGALARALARYGVKSTARAPSAATAIDEVTADQLALALHGNCIEAHYQPKIDLRTGQVDELEALARWRNADGTMIPPVKFIGVAERTGMIDPLSLCMLARILDDMAIWQRKGYCPTVSLNVSPQSLSQRGFSDALIEQVAAAGVDPGRIVLEITESAVATDQAVAMGCIGRLRMRGFGLSIDDYGTGFSSLQQLARLPFSELKIDRSFVRDADDSPRQQTILASAIDVGRRMGLRTVAEGIETETDLVNVAKLGCDLGQGFLFAKPMERDAILPWRAANRGRLAQLCNLARAA